jgi:hypothetical protein
MCLSSEGATQLKSFPQKASVRSIHRRVCFVNNFLTVRGNTRQNGISAPTYCTNHAGAWMHFYALDCARLQNTAARRAPRPAG